MNTMSDWFEDQQPKQQQPEQPEQPEQIPEQTLAPEI